MTGTAHIPYLERRAGGFLYRRRIPNRLCPSRSEKNSETQTFLRISLQTHVPADAKERAARLTRLCDTAFALMTEPGMDHLTQDQITMLETLARFQIAAHAAIRAAALPRSRAAVEHAAACERATQAVLQDALATGNRDLAREPLRAVAAQLGVTLVEDDADWNQLAFEATRILLDLSREREQVEYGRYNFASPIFSSVRSTPGTQASNQATSPFQSNSFAPAHLPIFAPTSAVTPRQMAIGVHLPMQPVTPASDPGSAAHRPFHAAVMPAHLQAANPAADAVPQPFVAPAAAEPSVQKTRAAAAKALSEDQARRIQMRPPKLDLIPVDRLPTDMQKILATKPRGITLNEGIKLFDALKTLGLGNEFTGFQELDPKAGEKWTKDSSSKTSFALLYWSDMLGDDEFEKISIGAIRDALVELPRIPAKHGKGTEHWRQRDSFRELIDETDNEEQQKIAENQANLVKSGNATQADFEAAANAAREPRLRSETVIKHRRHIAAIGRMLLDLQLIDTNPFEVCAVSNKTKKRLMSGEEGRVRTVWDDRIQDLFRTEVFQGKIDEPGDPLFWAPIISRLTGMRMEEVLQLDPKDFGSVENIPYVDVRNTEGNHTKSEAVERRIPIHPKLVEIGLLQLVELRKKQGQSRLFPHLKRGATKEKFSEIFTKAFTYYRQKHNVYWPGLDFHAFRTSFNGDLMNQDKSDAVRCAIMGHDFKDEGARSYRQGLGFRTMYERILDVKLDISAVVSPFVLEKTAGHAVARKNGLRVVQ